MAKPTDLPAEDVTFTLALMTLLQEEGLIVDDFYGCVKPPQFVVTTPLTKFTVQFKDGTVYVFDTSIATCHNSGQRAKRIIPFLLADPELSTKIAKHIKNYQAPQDLDPDNPFEAVPISQRLDKAQEFRDLK